MLLAISRYQVAAVETVSPLKLVVDLYDGALQQLQAAREAALARDVARRSDASRRAHAIITELRVTLDANHAPEIVSQLDGLYGFVLDRITLGNLEADATAFASAERVLRPLRDAWSEVLQGTR